MSDSNQTNINTEIHINEENKNILYMLANTAQCYAKLSYKSHKYYDKIQSCLTIPVIFFSTIIGTASLTNTSDFSTKYYFYLSMIIGFINILISILTTILRYFKISEYNEMYRVSHIAWDTYVRDILLILPNITDEDNFKLFFNKKLSEYSTLMDNTPIFPIRIINKFNKYTKRIENEYFKPSQISREIISIETYIEKFKIKTNQQIINKNIIGTNIDKFIEINRPKQISNKSLPETESDTKTKNCCIKIDCFLTKKSNIDNIELQQSL